MKSLIEKTGERETCWFITPIFTTPPQKKISEPERGPFLHSTYWITRFLVLPVELLLFAVTKIKPKDMPQDWAHCRFGGVNQQVGVYISFETHILAPLLPPNFNNHFSPKATTLKQVFFTGLHSPRKLQRWGGGGNMKNIHIPLGAELFNEREGVYYLLWMIFK